MYIANADSNSVSMIAITQGTDACQTCLINTFTPSQLNLLEANLNVKVGDIAGLCVVLHGLSTTQLLSLVTFLEIMPGLLLSVNAVIHLFSCLQANRFVNLGEILAILNI